MRCIYIDANDRKLLFAMEKHNTSSSQQRSLLQFGDHSKIRRSY